MKFRPRDAYLIFDLAGGPTLILHELSKSLPEGAIVRFGSGGILMGNEFRRIPHEDRQRAKILHGDRLNLSEIPFLEADLFHEIAFIQKPAVLLARKYLKSHTGNGTTLEQALEEAENSLLASFLAKRLQTIRPSEERFTPERLNRRLSRLLAVASEERAREWLPEILRHAGIEFSPENLQKASDAFEANRPPKDLVDQFEGAATLDEELYDHWMGKQEEQLRWLRAVNDQREAG